MGACLSCLGLARQSSPDNEPSETSRLLASGPSQPHYGSSHGPTAYHDFVDPDQERRDHESLEAMWKLTSDKLIDISTTTTSSIEHTAAAAPTATPLYASAPEIDFARLFRETFPRQHHHHHHRHHKHQRHTLANGSLEDSSAQDDTTDQVPSPTDEQSWLRNIIMRDPEDKSWDCNTVHRIGKPLVVEFDDSGGASGGGKHDEGGGAAVKALREAKDKLR